MPTIPLTRWHASDCRISPTVTLPIKTDSTSLGILEFGLTIIPRLEFPTFRSSGTLSVKFSFIHLLDFSLRVDSRWSLASFHISRILFLFLFYSRNVANFKSIPTVRKTVEINLNIFLTELNLNITQRYGDMLQLTVNRNRCCNSSKAWSFSINFHQRGSLINLKMLNHY